jgi:hypothetical protein
MTVKQLIDRLNKIENKEKVVLHKFNMQDKGWANIELFDEYYNVYITADCESPFSDGD